MYWRAARSPTSNGAGTEREPFSTHAAAGAIQALGLVDATVVGVAVDDDNDPLNITSSRGSTGDLRHPNRRRRVTVGIQRNLNVQDGSQWRHRRRPGGWFMRLVFDLAVNGSGLSQAILSAMLLVP